MKKNGNTGVLLALMFIAFPLRESVALMLGESTPMRIGEILMGFCPLFYILASETYDVRNRRASTLLFIFLSYSFLFGVLFADYLRAEFAIKYFVRGALFLYLVKLAEDKVIDISDGFVEKLFKYTVIVESFFCFLQLFGYTILYSKFGEYTIPATYGIIQRLSGTASEPGYLIPILTPCIYFFVSDFRKYKFWAITAFAMVFLTFSSFGYVAVLIVILLKILVKNRSNFIRYTIYSALSLSLIVAVSSQVFPQVGEVYDTLTAKVLAFTSMNEDEMDYSGAERTENLIVASEAFLEGDVLQKLLGQGIGATAYHTNNNVVIYEPAEEANNIYLSVLVNQGVLGLLILLMLFMAVYRQIVKDNVASMAFFSGFITQVLQYFIVGNLWLYFFWYYIFFIIAINRQTTNILQQNQTVTSNDSLDM